MNGYILSTNLQEAVFHMDGFNFGWALGLLEASGVLVGSTLERMHGGQGVCKRVAPFTSYFVLAGLLGISSALSNIALNYIQYPTKVRICWGWDRSGG